MAPPPALALIFRTSHGQQPAAGPEAVPHQERTNTNNPASSGGNSGGSSGGNSGGSKQNRENVAGDSLGSSPNVFRSIDQKVVSHDDTASFSSSSLSSSGLNEGNPPSLAPHLAVTAASLVTDAGADNAASPAHHRHAAHAAHPQPSQSGLQTPLSDHNNDNQVELHANPHEDWSFAITEKAPSRAFSWFKAPTKSMLNSINPR